MSLAILDQDDEGRGASLEHEPLVGDGLAQGPVWGNTDQVSRLVLVVDYDRLWLIPRTVGVRYRYRTT